MLSPRNLLGTVCHRNKFIAALFISGHEMNSVKSRVGFINMKMIYKIVSSTVVFLYAIGSKQLFSVNPPIYHLNRFS